MASELRVNTLKDASGNNSIATSFVAGGSAKCWVNFNGTGTIAARDSLNVSSLTDNSTGYYRTNISSAMSDANFNASVDRQVNNSTKAFCTGLGPEGNTSSRISQYVFYYTSGADAAEDEDYVYASAHGDLA